MEARTEKMKQLFLFFLSAILVLSACKSRDEIKTEDLAGRWEAYRYFAYNTDRTTKFFQDRPGWFIEFNASGSFREAYIDSLFINGSGQSDTQFATINGNWALADNEKLTLTDSVFVKRTLTIFNLQSDHVQLRSDTNQYYLIKK